MSASLAARTGSSIGDVGDRALDAYETAEFWRQTREALAHRAVDVEDEQAWERTSETASMTSEARRAEVWLLDLGEPIGHEQGWRRPALVVSSDEWNRHANDLTVLPLTRTRHGLPTRVEIEADQKNGLTETSYARCEDIRSVTDDRLVHRVGVVDHNVMHTISRVLRSFLEL